MKPTPLRHSALLRTFLVLVAVGLALTVLGGRARAQTDSATDGSTPSGLKPGSPAGSYQLSGFDNVNPYSGHLDFHLPLLKVGGRGAAGYTMTLPVEQKWLVEHFKYMANTNLHGHRYTPNPYWWGALRVGLGPGVMQARGSGHASYTCNTDFSCFRYTYTRLTFTGADGTEYEMRDRQTGGQPADCPSETSCGSGFNRGRVFVTADGTAATFLSDSDIVDSIMADAAEAYGVTGYLLLRDGTRHRFEGGLMRWTQDRNGNRVSYAYGTTFPSPSYGQVTSITDSLGRQVTVEYQVTDPNPDYGTGTRITFGGFGGAPRTLFLSEGLLEDSLHTGFVKKTLKGLFAGLDGSTSTYFNPTVVHSVWLPDGRRYRLSYNSHGEVARVVLPTGGAVEYVHAGGLSDGDPDGVVRVGSILGGGLNKQVYRRVTERRVYKSASDAAPESTMTVSRPESKTADGTTVTTLGYVDVEQHAGGATGAVLSRTRHHYHGSAAGSLKQKQGAFPGWREGREHATESLDTAGTAQTAAVLRRVEQTWRQRAPVSWWASWVSLYPHLTQEDEPALDPRLVTTVTRVEPSGANLVSMVTAIDPHDASGQTVGFDRYNNPTDSWEYDFGGGAPPAWPVRHTQTTFVTTAGGQDYACDPDATCGADQISAGVIHQRGLPRHSRVYAVNQSDGTETEVAHSETLYDETPLAPWYGAVAGWADPGSRRGNATTVKSWYDVASPAAFVQTGAAYDQVGNPVKAVDARGHETTTEYAADYAHALPTKVTSPVPDPTGTYGSAAAIVTTTAYDLWTGLVTSTADANGGTTTAVYDPQDELDRLKAVVRPDGGRTDYEYGDTVGNLHVRTRTDLDGAREITSEQLFDGLGRAYRARTYENHDPAKPWLTADTEYDALGRVKRASLPYRAAANASLFSSDKWTETVYDALGRAETVKTKPDDATITTLYSGNAVTVTDQAGKKRRSVTDALGRLTQVTEAPEVATCQATGAGCTTTYTYDVLGNLRKVDQGGQLRFFAYDSLSRLVRAKNPEQGAFTAGGDFPALTDSTSGTSNSDWSMGYLYDADGNLLKRKDTRGVVTTYAYDALNRNTAVTYTGETGATTPPVKRTYDGATLGKGRPFHSYSGGDETTGTTVQDTAVDAYDAAGRPLAQRQRFKTNGVWANSYPVNYEYLPGGLVKKVTYASGHAVNYRYDIAGRLADDGAEPAVKGTLGDGTPRAYASEVRYHELGGREQERFGTATPVYNKHFFNSRGQLAEVRVGTQSITSADPGHWNRGAILNVYSAQVGWTESGPDNNGNLRKQMIFVPHDDAISGWTQMTQFYGYDPLNRLQSVEEKRAATDFFQTYTYDRRGNRTVDAAGTWDAVPGWDVPEPQFEQDAANPAYREVAAPSNRLYAPGDGGRMPDQKLMRYDAAGNQVRDSYTGQGTRAYDAENRMTAAEFTSGQPQTALYTYDADGRRVKRRIGAGAEVWQVYGAGGELLAEYAAHASPYSPQKEYGYRGGELLVTAEAPAAPRTNVAAAADGATAAASSTYGANFPAAALINGDRNGSGWGTPTGGWNDGTPGAFPDWVEVTFSGSKTIDEVSVFTLQDNFSTPVEPTEALTFAQYGVTAFEVQAWVGSGWVTVQGGSVTGNDKVWRRVTFPPVTTTKVRVRVTAAADGASRLTEVEAWEAVGAAAQRTNHALSSAGAAATASSAHASGNFPPAAAINGDRKGAGWGAGGGWSDATEGSFPDWLEVEFPAAKAVDEVNIFTVQDAFSSPAEPTEAQTFSLYGLSEFSVQYWTGSQWVAVPGGGVSGNNKVWRRVTFPAVVTSRIRVLVTHALDGYSRVTELEAWGPEGAGGGGGSINWLVTDHLGTPRMVVDQSGDLSGERGVKRHDYLPFGEEIGAGVGGRTTGQGYSAVDNVRQKFTSKERDDETRLDYFLARYYSSAQGRFTSPDPLLSSGRPDDPRTWNRYSYVLNNPLMYVDPLGLFEWMNEGAEVSKKERKRREKFIKAYEELKKIRDQVGGKLGKDSKEYRRLEEVITTLGEPGEKTGVKIEFGETEGKDALAETHPPTWDMTKQVEYTKITVDIDDSGSFNRLVEAIGHEGAHAHDWKIPGIRQPGENNYKLEFRAFEVSSFIQEAQGDSRGYKGGGGKIWRSEWKNVDRQTLHGLRRDAINKFLSTNKTYKRTAHPPQQ